MGYSVNARTRADSRKVVLVLGCFLLLDAWLSSYQLGPLPPRVYLQGIALVYTFFHAKRFGVPTSMKSGTKFWTLQVFMLWWVLFDTFLGALIYQVGLGDLVEAVYYFGGRIVAGVLLGWLTAYWTADRPAVQARLTKWAGFIITLSAVVAIAQWYRVPQAWQLVANLGRTQAAGSSDLLWAVTVVRPMGLGGTVVVFSYQLLLALPFCFHWAMKGKGWVQRTFWFACTGVVTVAVVLNGTRSALAAAGFVLVTALAFYMRRWPQFVVGSAVVLGVLAGMSALQSTGQSPLVERVLTIGTESDLSRLTMLAATGEVVLSNPLGTGLAARQSLLTQQGALAGGIGGEILSETTVHNQFANVLVAYGVPGLVMLLLFYRWLLVRSLQSIRAGSDLSFPLLLGIGAHLLNSMLHNGGPFNGDPFVWYFVGLLVAQQIRTDARNEVAPDNSQLKAVQG